MKKGFAEPRRSWHRRDAHWRPYRYDVDIVVRQAPRRVARPRVVFRAEVIVDLLGPRLYSEVLGFGRYRGEPVARWVPVGDRGWVLQVREDGRPIAELIDRDGDRRIDDVWLYDVDRYDDRYGDRYNDRWDDRDDRYDDWNDDRDRRGRGWED